MPIAAGIGTRIHRLEFFATKNAPTARAMPATMTSTSSRESHGLRVSPSMSSSEFCVECKEKRYATFSADASSWVRGPNRHLRHEAAVVELEHGHDGLGNVAGDELAG